MRQMITVFKKIAWYRRAAVRPPYEIVKTYGSRKVAEQFSTCELLLRKHYFTGRKTVARQTFDNPTKSHLDTVVDPVNQMFILPCDGHTAASRSSHRCLATLVITAGAVRI